MIRRVYGGNSLSRTQCYEWFRRFKSGRESIEDDHRSGRPSTSTDDSHVSQIDEIVHSNRRLTIREMSDDCGISFGSCQRIWTEHLRMHTQDTHDSKSWVLHHDNAPAHSSLLIRDYCAKSETTVLPQPPYSLALPRGLFPFPKVKIHAEGTTIRFNRRHQREFAGPTSRHPKSSLPDRVQELETTLGAVHYQQRGVL